MRSKGKKRVPAPPADAATAVALLAWLESAGVATISEAQVLFAAADPSAALSVSELARRCKMPMSSVSRLVWGLTERGLLSLNSVQGDRRKKIVRAELGAAA